jgi:uncharacterized protein
VLDPGVIIAALISSKGAPRTLLRSWFEGRFELVVCSALLLELERVLLRTKFRPYVTPAQARAYVAVIRRFAEFQPDPAVTPGKTPDPGDDYLVALARAADAHVLISGDPHLCKLKAPQPPVLTLREFLEILDGP